MEGRKATRHRKMLKRKTRESVYNITITLPHDQIEYIRGKGNASQEVRKAISDRMGSESQEAYQKLEDDEVIADWKLHMLEADIKNPNSEWKWLGEKRDAVVRELRAEHNILVRRLATVRANRQIKEHKA